MDTHEESGQVEHTASNEQPPRESQPAQLKRQSWIEVLVDPRTLQGLMLCGGALLVLGLVVWLWSIGIFENKLVVASCLGVANVAMLAAGVSGAKFSRYQTASRAITMLACLVMPLNLWFYDAQGLITLDQGGSLWVPALVCCALYVLVARVLADPLFVNAIVGGVTMTGLLILADHQVGRLWEIMAPSSFLVILGMVCIHIERAFPPEEGPFSRAKFGRAFFQAGHFVMASGLMVLLVGRLAGRLYDPYFAGRGWFAMPEVATQANLKLMAIAVALAGAYSYVYSQIVVQAKGRYVISAVLTLIWSAIILLDLLHVAFTAELVMLIAATTALMAAIARRSADSTNDEEENPGIVVSLVRPIAEHSDLLAKALSSATLAIGLVLACRTRIDFLHDWISYEYTGMFIVAALVGAVASWLVVGSNDNESKPSWSHTAAVVLAWLAIDATLVSLGVTVTAFTLAMQMLVPLAVVAYSFVAPNRRIRLGGAMVAEVWTLLSLMTAVGAEINVVRGASISHPSTWLTIFFAAAAVSFGLASRVSARRLPAIMAAISICAATWQLMLLLGVTEFEFILATTLIGLVCLAVSRFARPVNGSPSQFTIVGQWTGRICISLSSVATLLIGLARLLTGESSSTLIGLLIVQSAAGGVAGLLSRESVWRRHFWVLATAQAIITALVINALSTLSIWQRFEVLLTVGGLVSLALGYLGWSRETDKEEEIVSFHLSMGSLLSAIPLTLGMLVQRFDDRAAEWGWALVHEGGVLIIGLVLLGSGVLCRIRWSTIVGGSTLLVYVVSLVGLIHLPEQLQTTAIYMMVGGGLFFGTAVLLSVYRDRLLSIPQRMEAGEGVFRVLKWR